MSELKTTKKWFEVAIPEPTIETACVQIGCHFEEVAEMMEALGLHAESLDMHKLSDQFKKKSEWCIALVEFVDFEELADSMGDQIVTGTGVMHNFRMNPMGILSEISRSNFSKFEDGKPVFDENGKITKGKHYTPPDLTPYI